MKIGKVVWRIIAVLCVVCGLVMSAACGGAADQNAPHSKAEAEKKREHREGKKDENRELTPQQAVKSPQTEMLLKKRMEEQRKKMDDINRQTETAAGQVPKMEMEMSPKEAMRPSTVPPMKPGVQSVGVSARNQPYDGDESNERNTRNEGYQAYEPAPTDFRTEEYDHIRENEFKDVLSNPLSTFSIDVDTASYSNVRRFLSDSRMPPFDAVRIEEMINYFTYDYPQPKGSHPFSIFTEISRCPWNTERHLVHIGLQGKRLNYDQLKPCNFVFLVDSSGSMSSLNKLPLLKQSLVMMLAGLDDRDRVAIVAYAGSAGLVLPSTSAARKDEIARSLGSLRAGGTTAGGAGIQLAYRVAAENYIKDGNNRVILCTDGDFNVGVSSTGELVRLMEEQRKKDIYLTICGFGMGNYKDGRMEQISNAGNGNYFYIDSIHEARKVFVTEMRANMFTIAKDVKIQVEFNPVKIKAYRLVGYENRMMAAEDFEDDTKDAGELGAGHTVTALYEVILADSPETVRKTPKLKYKENRIAQDLPSTVPDVTGEVMTVKLRYKSPKEQVSRLLEVPVIHRDTALADTSANFRFSAAVAAFAQVLRHSRYKGNISFGHIRHLAQQAVGDDVNGYRAEFLRMVDAAAILNRTK